MSFGDEMKNVPASHDVCIKTKIQTQVPLSPDAMANQLLKWVLSKAGNVAELVEPLPWCAGWLPSRAEEKTVLSENRRE